MKRNYDFRKAKKGAVLPAAPGKTRITIRIDDDVLEWFRKEVHEAGGGNYQTLMNEALRQHVEDQVEPLEDTLLQEGIAFSRSAAAADSEYEPFEVLHARADDVSDVAAEGLHGLHDDLEAPPGLLVGIALDSLAVRAYRGRTGDHDAAARAHSAKDSRVRTSKLSRGGASVGACGFTKAP